MTEEILLNELKRQNPWWSDENVVAADPAFPKRDAFGEIQKLVDGELITAVTGLRRIGKTTLIKQIINELLSKSSNKQRILYFSFEESALADNKDILEKIIESQLAKHKNQKLYFFFDEIQYVDFWNAVLKKYVDYGWPLKFVVTGSSSLFIKTKARESLAGRILEHSLWPLNYGEYLRFFKVTSNIDSFFDYLTFGEFPYLSKLGNVNERRQYVLDWVIGKIVQSDLPKLRRIIHRPSLVNLVNVLISGSGQLVEMQNIASDLGIDVKTLTGYLEMLEEAKLIEQTFNLGAGFRTRSVRQRKIYSASVNAVTLSGVSDPGKLVENFIANYLYRNGGDVYIWRQRQKEVDFVWIKNGEKLPVEVKFQNQIRKSDLTNLLLFCKKAGVKKAMVITKNDEKIETVGDVEISFIPAYHLLT